MRTLLTALSLLLATAGFGEEPSPYAGQQQRTIKSLSDAEIGGLRSGKGMGLAKLAELNHYPGPKHVLELAGQLALSDEQRKDTEALYEAMRTEAITLGEQIIAAERALDTRFANGEISELALEEALLEIGQLRARLRLVHLRAHLSQKALLSNEQVAAYDRLRGYSRHGAAAAHGKHRH